MKIVCGWCQKTMGVKEPVEDQVTVTHGICPSCFKKQLKKSEENPQMNWELIVGNRKQPRVYARTIGGVLKQTVSKEARAWRLLEESPTAPIDSYGTFETEEEAKAAAALRATRYLVKANPGEAWHAGKMEEAERSEKKVTKQSLKDFYHGKSVAHFESALEERARKKVSKNPIAVFGIGNPPNEVHATIEGIVYNRCLEVRAEKTGSFKRGLWRHPFSKKSKVQILALDNGDLLLHSTVGVRLWKQG